MHNGQSTQRSKGTTVKVNKGQSKQRSKYTLVKGHKDQVHKCQVHKGQSTQWSSSHSSNSQRLKVFFSPTTTHKIWTSTKIHLVTMVTCILENVMPTEAFVDFSSVVYAFLTMSLPFLFNVCVVLAFPCLFPECLMWTWRFCLEKKPIN